MTLARAASYAIAVDHTLGPGSRRVHSTCAAAIGHSAVMAAMRGPNVRHSPTLNTGARGRRAIVKYPMRRPERTRSADSAGTRLPRRLPLDALRHVLRALARAE